MLFNSFEFLVFIVAVYVVYWILKGQKKYQNPFLLCVSYIFYGWWDWRYLFLLLLSTFIDYSFGILIYQSNEKKKLFLRLSIFNNLIVLLFFKYYNFFAGSAGEFLHFFGLTVNPVLIDVVLPVGISFYTFHGMSYVLDIYRGNFKPVRNFYDYGLFVSFFPLLVAGPIERATHLLPQVTAERKFNYGQSVDGLRLILWGLFKKIVIADNCAVFVNPIFDNYNRSSPFELIAATVVFAFQLYGDFSGYSDIARGTAKLFGIELLVNFKTPFFSGSITEFWRRWHISLSSWFNDYVYTPLAIRFRDYGKTAIALSAFFTFLITGFWHGAGWKYIFFGALHGIAIVYEILTRKWRKKIFKQVPDGVVSVVSAILTFSYVCFTLIFFRSNTLSDAFRFIGDIFSHFYIATNFKLLHPYLYIFILVLLFMLTDWKTRDIDFIGLCKSFKKRYMRLALYFVLVGLIGLYGAYTHTAFIYFQF